MPKYSSCAGCSLFDISPASSSLFSNMLDDKKRLENALVSSAMAKAGDGMLRDKAQRWVLYSGIRTFHQILQGEFTLITDQNHLVKTPEGIEQPAAGRFQRWTLVESHCLAWGGL